MKIIASPSSRIVRVVGPLTSRGVIRVASVQRVIAEASSSQVVDRDSILIESVSPTVVTDFQLSLKTVGGVRPQTITWTVDDALVATVDAQGYLSWVSDGVVNVTATIDGGLAVTTRVRVYTSTPGSSRRLDGYVDGSLAAHVSEMVDARLAAVPNPAVALRMYTTQNHATNTYIRNSACWTSRLTPLDLSAISPWNSTGGVTRAGTLIHPRFIIFAAHYQIAIGATVRFVRMDGTVVTATVIAKKTHPSYTPYFPDVTVGLLDRDIAVEGIDVVPTLPPDWRDYVPDHTSNRPLAALCLDQEEKALTSDWVSSLGISSFSPAYTINDAQRNLYYEPKVGGDSGNPAFLIINHRLVILCVWTYGGGGGGTSIPLMASDINAMMTELLGSSAEMTLVDISEFDAYPAE